MLLNLTDSKAETVRIALCYLIEKMEKPDAIGADLMAEDIARALVVLAREVLGQLASEKS